MDFIIPYEEVQFLLVYMHVDKSFLICSIRDTNWNETNYKELLENVIKSKINVSYDDSIYEAIILQCGRKSADLTKAESYLVRVKNEKHLPVERLLQLISRFSDEKRRQSVLPLKSINTDLSSTEADELAPIASTNTLYSPSTSFTNDVSPSNESPSTPKRVRNDQNINVPRMSMPPPASPNQNTSVLQMLRQIIQQQHQIIQHHGSLSARLSRNFQEINSSLQQLETKISFSQSESSLSVNNTLTFEQIKTMDDVEGLIIKLSGSDGTFKNKLTDFLISIGGVDLKDFVSRCMKIMFTDDVLVMFNRTGRKGKHKFPTSVETLLIDSAKKSQPNSTNKQVEIEICRILHNIMDSKCKKRKSEAAIKTETQKDVLLNIEESSEDDC